MPVVHVKGTDAELPALEGLKQDPFREAPERCAHALMEWLTGVWTTTAARLGRSCDVR